MDVLAERVVSASASALARSDVWGDVLGRNGLTTRSGFRSISAK